MKLAPFVVIAAPLTIAAALMAYGPAVQAQQAARAAAAT
jgi:hypothetical protein